MAESSPPVAGEALTPTRAIAVKVRELRRKRGWTAAELGKRLTAFGIKWDRSIVANLENGRRVSVSVGELLGLAYVFEVAPVDLLIPGDEEAAYAIADGVSSTSGRVRAWVVGEFPLPGLDPLLMLLEQPRARRRFVEEWARG
jgi:transcriptional regulator with XRE-family HTH domain